MSDLSIVITSTFVPRHDGLATFAADLERGVSDQPGVQTRVIAIEPEDETLHYGRRVVGRIQQGDPDSYLQAARSIRRLHPQVVSVQHEYGLWGEWGDGLEKDYAVPFIEAVASQRVPVVTTLHTIRPSPPEFERNVVRRHGGKIRGDGRDGSHGRHDPHGRLRHLAGFHRSNPPRRPCHPAVASTPLQAAAGAGRAYDHQHPGYARSAQGNRVRDTGDAVGR